MLDLTGHMIIWDGLFAHGDESTGLMKVVFCYTLPMVVQGLSISTVFIVKFCNMPRHASHKMPKPFLGELLPLL
jgi:hypothetical protein